jgi:hypothetical protein
MTNQELISTLKKASESQDNIALQMLLIIAAERIERLHAALYGDKDERTNSRTCRASGKIY